MQHSTHRVRSNARRWALLVAPLAVVSGTLAATTPASAQAAPYTVVVSGLRNPRGLAINAAGTLFVAEAGEAGAVCFAGLTTEEGGPTCAGSSSRISRINTVTKKRSDYATGLLSVGGPLFAIGASGIAVKGNDVFAVLGLNDRTVPPAAACGGGSTCKAIVATARKQVGHLVRVGPFGYVNWRADVGAFNYDWTVAHKNTIGAGNPSYQPGWSKNPDFMPGDANPYGLASAYNGTYMVDGGSNTLTWTPNGGSPRVLAAYPNPPVAHRNAYDSVPTCVAPTEKGVVVADFNGQIFLTNTAHLLQKPAKTKSIGGAFLVGAGGCTYDNFGHVYITDILSGGLVKLDLRTLSLSWVRPPGTFNFPSGLVVSRDLKSLYVSNNGVCPSFPTPVGNGNPCGGVTGQVVKVHL